MVKLLFFPFPVTISRIKKKKIHSELLTFMGELLFFLFQITNKKLINENNPINITVWISVNPYILQNLL